MSTEVLLTNLELMRSDLEDFINDEPLDMLDEFDAETIAGEVITIAAKLMVSDVVEHHVMSRGRIWNYQIKVNNRYKGFVSVSEEVLGITGVSRTEYKPFYEDDEDGWWTGLCSLAQMINEAWYECNQ
jgi:hypothetical protein